MKLAFLVSRFPVLSETFVLSQIADMLELGHSVDIIAGEPDIGMVFPEILELNRHNLRSTPPSGIGLNQPPGKVF